jgi:hypothetical protein
VINTVSVRRGGGNFEEVDLTWCRLLDCMCVACGAGSLE